MEIEIKSSLLKKDNINEILYKEEDNLLTESIKDFENNNNKSQDNIKVNNLNKAKELLKTLLKKSLDERLTLLEKKEKVPSILDKTTKELNKTITSISLKVNKIISDKIKKEKEKQSKLKPNKYGGNKKGLSPRRAGISKTRTNFYRAKTPSHYNKTGNNIHNKTPIVGLKRELIKSKSNMALVKSSKTIDANRTSNRFYNKQRTMGSKNKSSVNIKKKNPNDSDDLQTMSVTSIKTNKTNNTTTLNTISNSKISNKLPLNKNKKNNTELTLKINKGRMSKMSNKNIYNFSDNNIIHINNKKNTTDSSSVTLEEKKKRKKTPFKKKNNKNEVENVKIINNIKKKEKTIEDEIDAILSMESKLQKDIDNNDPLLILPLKDLDFIPKGLLRRNSVRSENPNRERKYSIISFNIQEKLDNINFNNILKYLSLSDLISIKNTSKKFRQIIILYLIEYLDKEQNQINDIISKLNIEKIPDREGIENLVLSKGSKKAIQLLNEAQLNNLFKDDKIPIDDIILIYRIYFQIINHSFALIAKTDIEKFWENCKYYFRNEQNGNTGDILVDIIDNKKLEVNGNNLYQVYNLVKGNWNKILPNYFSSVCGTTGLFAFIIKDILEFLGLTFKIKKKGNAYWTYSDIIEAIKEKINYLKNIKI